MMKNVTILFYRIYLYLIVLLRINCFFIEMTMKKKYIENDDFVNFLELAEKSGRFDIHFADGKYTIRYETYNKKYDVTYIFRDCGTNLKRLMDIMLCRIYDFLVLKKDTFTTFK